MNSVIDLLTEKNHFLDKFINLNENEILNFMDGNFDNLDSFYNSREKLLNILTDIDSKIEEESIFEYEGHISNELKKKIIKALDYKNEVVKQILAQDLQILSLIEEAKSIIIKELSQVKTTRKVFNSYKSEKGPAQDKLDEKA
jgi:hypothetical protein